jgi:hypothetical protein
MLLLVPLFLCYQHSLFVSMLSTFFIWRGTTSNFSAFICVLMNLLHFLLVVQILEFKVQTTAAIWMETYLQ